MATILMNIFSWALSIGGFIGVLGLLPFSVVGIVFLFLQSNEKNSEKKKFYKKIGIFLLVLPWVLILGALILLVILNTVKFMFLGV